ncbi:MAG: hypothetical protein HPAVJP_3680 [Candidatus Hepatoplasma vulgare]|nr:MAG: hypothetical protein HPAVJP_3680 [Candidatus Hepatoplasma sp.]
MLYNLFMIRLKNLYFLFSFFIIFTFFWGSSNLYFKNKDSFNYENNSSLQDVNDLNNPYIEKNGFEIKSWEAETSSVIFTLTIVGDWIVKPINVSLYNDEELISVTASNISSHVIDTDNNEVEYGYRIQGLDITNSNEYTFYSLDNTNLAIEDNGDSIDDQILLSEELNVTNELTFDLSTTNNAYTSDSANNGQGEVKILITSNKNVVFSILISDNWAVQDKLYINIQRNWTGSVLRFNVYANLLYEEDLEGEFTNFYYVITDNNNNIVPGTYYSYKVHYVYSPAYLALRESSNVVKDIVIDTNTFYFESPYIVENSFEILNDSTDYSIKFQIGLINNRHKDFDPSKSLNVTLKDIEGNNYSTTANYVSAGSESNTYIYEITELENNKPLNVSTNYSIFSIDNEWLAVGSNINDIDNEILLEDDLGAEGSFTTANAYILEEGFKIIEYNDTSVKYTITVEGWENDYKNYENEIDVRLISEDNSEGDIYQSKFIEKNGNEYTYEITGLNDETSYTFYSLENTKLSINDKATPIDEEIILTEDLGIDSSFLIFKTEKTKIPNYVWIILAIIIMLIIIIGIIILIRILNRNKREKREFNELLNEDIKSK